MARAIRQSQPVPQISERNRSISEHFENMEMSDGSGQELGGVVAAKDFENGRWIDGWRVQFH